MSGVRTVVADNMKRVSTWLNQMSTQARAARSQRPYEAIVSEAMQGQSVTRALPKFDANGKLPVGVHDADLGSFLVHVGTNDHRKSLYAPFGERLLQLRERGVKSVYVGGSGISNKPDPGDVDALFHLRDARKLPIRERMDDWMAGTHWHAAERGHWAPHTGWGLTRPTWLEYFSHYAGRGPGTPQPQAIVRVVLDDAMLGAAQTSTAAAPAASAAAAGVRALS